MPGRPYLARRRQLAPVESRTRRMEVEAGLRQQGREGRDPGSPIDEAAALAAAGRPRQNSATSTMAERPLASAMKAAGLPFAHKPIGGE
jgi:hypothetical protein